jgi:hypothetical protein
MAELQKRFELACVPALDEEGVGIMALGQHDAAGWDPVRPKMMG